MRMLKRIAQDLNPSIIGQGQNVTNTVPNHILQ